MLTVILTLIHLSWALPQTVAGLVVWLLTTGSRRYRFHAANVSAWKHGEGLSLGLYIFLPDTLGVKQHRELLVHEYGHTVQSAILGPFYIPLIVIPSLIWAGAPRLIRYRKKRGISYYSLYTERWANHLGEKFTGGKSPGQSF